MLCYAYVRKIERMRMKEREEGVSEWWERQATYMFWNGMGSCGESFLSVCLPSIYRMTGSTGEHFGVQMRTIPSRQPTSNPTRSRQEASLTDDSHWSSSSATCLWPVTALGGHARLSWEATISTWRKLSVKGQGQGGHRGTEAEAEAQQSSGIEFRDILDGGMAGSR